MLQLLPRPLLVAILILLIQCGCDQSENTLERSLKSLQNKCFDSLDTPDWWTYVWCNEKYVKQVHYDPKVKKIVASNNIGYYSKEESGINHQIYRSKIADCVIEGTNDVSHRYTEVAITCCDETLIRNNKKMSKYLSSSNNVQEYTFIESVTEPIQCSYYVTVCSTAACPDKKKINAHTVTEVTNTVKAEVENNGNNAANVKSSADHSDINNFETFFDKNANILLPNMTTQLHFKERVKSMFYHAYDSYMTHAYPEAELRPISCEGGKFDLIEVPLVTLIDSLDTLVVLGNHTEFRRAVALVSNYYSSFDINVNVSVFETTIRILGGLLSAHLMAIDPKLKIYPYRDITTNAIETYNNSLLHLAKDLGDRLIPAFNTHTGIPYGTVNLKFGVPKGESEVASVAGAGSLIIEFETLSALTSDQKYGDVADKAVEAIYSRRSSIGLLGKHINIKTGKWVESSSGIGSNSDSFYEYLLKYYLLFRDIKYFEMFKQTYISIKKFVQVGDNFFSDVDMFNGKMRRNRLENLQAFWPGMEASVGQSGSSGKLLNSLYAVWADLGFLPEELDFIQWIDGKPPINGLYPLRPELVESTYHQYRATNDRSWLVAGVLFLESLERFTRTECGYATVTNVLTFELTDLMPSFFLSETCKYLYLLFDEFNFVHDRAYIFSTEAHLFDPMQLPKLQRVDKGKSAIRRSHKREQLAVTKKGNNADKMENDAIADKVHELPVHCPKRLWWDSVDSYKVDYFDFNAAPNSNTQPKVVFQGATITEKEMIREVSIRNARNLSALLKIALGKNFTGSTSFMRLTKELKPKRPQTCYSDEEPAVDVNAAQHVLDVNMGVLGDFTVHVYPDGFVVNSKQYKDIVEVSNVGKSILLVRDINEDSVKTTIGHKDGTILTCSVSVIFKSEKVNIDTKWSRPCSVATFNTFESVSVESEVYIAGHRSNSDSEFCTLPASQKPKRQWWQWNFPALAPIFNGIGEDNSNDNLDDKIVLAMRGGCLFEDKALLAQNAGAAALIVANVNDNLFIMSGKDSVDDTPSIKKKDNKKGKPVGSPTSTPAIASQVPTTPVIHKVESEVSIPTVMITAGDMKSLTELLDLYRDKAGIKVTLKIDINAVPDKLDSEHLGYDNMPKLRLTNEVIYVLGRSHWGFILLSKNAQEWQLFILNKGEIYKMLPRPAVRHNSPITAKYDAVQMYSLLLKRKCGLQYSFRNNALEIE